MTEQETVLQIENLSVDIFTRKGSFHILNGINWSLRQGEVFGIVGESGCGKTMTALTIMRLLPSMCTVSSGKVLLRGLDLLRLSEREMRDIRGNEISMIFQEPMTALNPVFTTGTQIVEALQSHQSISRQEAKDRAVEILRAVGIAGPEQRMAQYPHELSGGMRQRVMIAMALICQPSVLIADEPTTAVDVTIQAQIFELLLDIKNKMGTSIILITHDMAAIAELAQRVFVMYAGFMVEEGPVHEILNSPCHPYTKGLLESIPKLVADPGPNKKELKELPGIVPDLTELGNICPFAPRCSYVTDQCRNRIPPTLRVNEDHLVACWAAS